MLAHKIKYIIWAPWLVNTFWSKYVRDRGMWCACGGADWRWAIYSYNNKEKSRARNRWWSLYISYYMRCSTKEEFDDHQCCSVRSSAHMYVRICTDDALSKCTLATHISFLLYCATREVWSTRNNTFGIWTRMDDQFLWIFKLL